MNSATTKKFDGQEMRKALEARIAETESTLKKFETTIPICESSTLLPGYSAVRDELLDAVEQHLPKQHRTVRDEERRLRGAVDAVLSKKMSVRRIRKKVLDGEQRRIEYKQGFDTGRIVGILYVLTKQRRETASALETHAEYVELHEEARRVDQRIRLYGEIAFGMKETAGELAKRYDSNRTFRYFTRVTSFLGRLFGRGIRYEEAKRKYGALRAVPDAVRKNREMYGEKLRVVMGQISRLESSAEQEHGVLDANRRLQDAIQANRRAASQLENYDHGFDRLLSGSFQQECGLEQDYAEVAQAWCTYVDRTIGELIRQGSLPQESVNGSVGRASLASLRQKQAELTEYERQLHNLRDKQETTARRLSYLRAMEREVCTNGYDAMNSSFEGFDLDMCLAELVGRKVILQDVLRKVHDCQRFNYREFTFEALYGNSPFSTFHAK